MSGISFRRRNALDGSPQVAVVVMSFSLPRFSPYDSSSYLHCTHNITVAPCTSKSSLCASSSPSTKAYPAARLRYTKVLIPASVVRAAPSTVTVNPPNHWDTRKVLRLSEVCTKPHVQAGTVDVDSASLPFHYPPGNCWALARKPPPLPNGLFLSLPTRDKALAVSHYIDMRSPNNLTIIAKTDIYNEYAEIHGCPSKCTYLPYPPPSTSPSMAPSRPYSSQPTEVEIFWPRRRGRLANTR